MESNTKMQIAGFKFAALPAGIKKSGKPDLALIYSETPARCAGVFTTNRVVAAPLLLTMPRIKAGFCQAVLVNSGNANACTGAGGWLMPGVAANWRQRPWALAKNWWRFASTGVIGARLPLAKFEKHVPLLPGNLSFEGT